MWDTLRVEINQKSNKNRSKIPAGVKDTQIDF